METLKENLIKKLGAENFQKVQAAKIGIAGAGGLGSNCAAMLVRCGFRRLKIVDFDKVSPANLDRQFFFADQVGMDKVRALKASLERINDALRIETSAKRIGPSDIKELFGDCDAVAECLDAAEEKSMLVSGLLSLGKFTVSASGLGGIGSSDDIKVHRVKDNLIVVGDLKSDVASSPALAPRVTIAAAKEADIILGHIIGLPHS